MRRSFTIFALPITLAAALVAFGACPRAAPDTVTPRTDAVFTSTRQVMCLTTAPGGTLWVGTTGGVLRRDPQGRWRKWDRLSGLPSSEVQAIMLRAGVPTVVCPTAAAAWNGTQWQAAPGVSHDDVTRRAVWNGIPIASLPTGLKVGAGASARMVPLPSASAGTHISALLPHGKSLWAALFGDGMWSWDGHRWARVAVGLPSDAREITALAARGAGGLWVGTRRGGVFGYDGAHWAHFQQPGEPANHNAEAVAWYDGCLFVSTLEDGLSVRTPQGWRQVTAPMLSSDAPRQMVVFQNALYVCHGNGLVDRFDGTRWTANVFPRLPRRQVSALTTDGKSLFLAQWGGWSEWDGARWTHHLNMPDLQGLPITALCPTDTALWVGTQGRGLAEVNTANETVRWHDEREGLPDDWVTCLASVGGRLSVGTFVSGLAQWDGKRWAVAPELAGQNVTALEPDGQGGLCIATRQGVWSQAAGQTALASLNARCPFLDPEVQALAATPGGLWVGERTGLAFVPERRTAPPQRAGF